MQESQIISLNIVYSYPVKWDKYHVLRDFVQNFYDATGYRSWHSKFHYSYEAESGQLAMWIDSGDFSYEWLLHIGASTKTTSGATNAGFFGEGFKIASLCSIRDYGWGVKMYSRDWALEVITLDDTIDSQHVNMLAYKISPSMTIRGSRLEISNISAESYEIFKDVLDSFYYPENKLLGRMIYSSYAVAVYERSSVSLNKSLPKTYGAKGSGAVFCAYQMLGTCAAPLVFCLHDYKSDDRERNTLHKYEVDEIILKIASSLPPDAAVEVLEKLRRYWNTSPVKKEIEIKHWSRIINELILRSNT